jgi:hypothetical protein
VSQEAGSFQSSRGSQVYTVAWMFVVAKKHNTAASNPILKIAKEFFTIIITLS